MRESEFWRSSESIWREGPPPLAPPARGEGNQSSCPPPLAGGVRGGVLRKYFADPRGDRLGDEFGTLQNLDIPKSNDFETLTI